VRRDLAPAMWRSQPWKNGGGVTREIVRWPDVDEYDVRVSVAEVTQAGPFSQFVGYRRWSVLIGGSIILATRRGLAGETGSIYRLSKVGDIVELDGDLAIDATLPAGPATLFNVIARGAVRVRVGAPRGPMRLAFALEEGGELARGHARLFDPPERLDQQRVIWIE
jgi:uncharacterized protein